MSIEFFQSLVSFAGKSFGLDDLTAEEKSAYVIGFGCEAQRFSVVLCYDENNNEIITRAELGIPTVEKPGVVLALLLSRNLFLDESGGAVYLMNPASYFVHLQRRDSLGIVDCHAFAKNLMVLVREGLFAIAKLKGIPNEIGEKLDSEIENFEGKTDAIPDSLHNLIFLTDRV